MPIVSRVSGILGALLLGHSHPGAFTQREEGLMIKLAGHAVMALENARLREAAQRARLEAEEAEQRYRRLLQQLDRSGVNVTAESGSLDHRSGESTSSGAD